MSNQPPKLKALLELSHELAAPPHPLAILGEGNTSARLSEKTFLVKASGSNLASLQRKDVVECRSGVLLSLLAQGKVPDSEVETSLLASRVDARAKKPSVEALFHAWLLSLPGVGFVGHTHAPAVTGILCSPRAEEFARKRMFPDEIVCCDVESVFVPYTDPGLGLARAIEVRTNRFISKYSRAPRVILLKNHGIITLGQTPQAVMAAMMMAEKAASIWTGAAALRGPVFLTAQQVSRIATRPDEAFRRKKLKI